MTFSILMTMNPTTTETVSNATTSFGYILDLFNSSKCDHLVCHYGFAVIEFSAIICLLFVVFSRVAGFMNATYGQKAFMVTSAAMFVFLVKVHTLTNFPNFLILLLASIGVAGLAFVFGTTLYLALKEMYEMRSLIQVGWRLVLCAFVGFGMYFSAKHDATMLEQGVILGSLLGTAVVIWLVYAKLYYDLNDRTIWPFMHFRRREQANDPHHA
uniref:7TMR-DISM_7TM domain-containing protein n=1 Tax=Panagrellus redivivus TaxID=6233 RepID=A0A7E4ZX72_PANRE